MRATSPEPARLRVPGAFVDWNDEFAYAPQHWTHPDVLANGRHLADGGRWADPPDVLSLRTEVEQRTTIEQAGEPKRLGDVVRFDPKSGAPLNPMGRTGLGGRGQLGRWGPNPAVDPIITRRHPTSGHLQVLVVGRSDAKGWALPGVLERDHETPPQALRRAFAKFGQAVGEGKSPDEMAAVRVALNELIKLRREVFAGYTADPRNTDHAWIETKVFHLHCSSELAKQLSMREDSENGAFVCERRAHTCHDNQFTLDGV